MSYTLNLLKNKKVVIIGGSSGKWLAICSECPMLICIAGIGLSIAAGALAQGAHVVVSSSSQKKVDAAVAELKTSSENVVSGVALNVKNFDRLKAFLDEVGPFDHFVSFHLTFPFSRSSHGYGRSLGLDGRRRPSGWMA
jgi:NAD(P)-dependent dehydrogenase (short-subunit alcohol dehydrogenase family)